MAKKYENLKWLVRERTGDEVLVMDLGLAERAEPGYPRVRVLVISGERRHLVLDDHGDHLKGLTGEIYRLREK